MMPASAPARTEPRRLRLELTVLLSCGLAGALVGCATTGRPTPGTTTELPPDLPPEYQQIIPRGRIASIDEPEFVSAEEAEIPDDAWILGVAIDNRAKAYSLNLLNSHEIVNDTSGDVAFAAVW